MTEKPQNPPNNIRLWRMRMGWSQEQLAEAVGTTGGMIHQIETGQRGLNTRWLYKIAPALGTTPGSLLDKDPRDADDEILSIWERAAPEERRKLITVAEVIVPFRSEADDL